MATEGEQAALFAGEGNRFGPGDRVRDPRTGMVGTVTGIVPVLPKVWVQWQYTATGLPGPFSAHLEAELEAVEP